MFVPVDVVKERLQVQRKGVTDPSMNYKGSVDAVRTIMRNEGLRGIYKGYGATLLSFGPFSAFHFLFYETVRRYHVGRKLLLHTRAECGRCWSLLSSAQEVGGEAIGHDSRDAAIPTRDRLVREFLHAAKLCFFNARERCC